MTEPLDLTAIKALLDEATPSPWRWRGRPGEGGELVGAPFRRVLTTQEEVPAVVRLGPDARLIAEAPETMAALVAEVERLRSERTVTREDVAKAMDLAWGDFVGDTGNYPDCFIASNPRTKFSADFYMGNFATMVTDWLNRPGDPIPEGEP